MTKAKTLTLIGSLIDGTSKAFLGHARVNKRRMKGDGPEIDLRKLQSASTGIWLFRRKSERLSLIVSRTNAVVHKTVATA